MYSSYPKILLQSEGLVAAINGGGLGPRDNGHNDLGGQGKNGYSGGDKANGFNLSVNELRKFNLLK